jgi:YVTN family beta-propeller protein
MAAPHVSGVAALILSRNIYLMPADVQTILADTATDLGPVGYDLEYGHGLVDANAAVQGAFPSTEPSVIATLAVYRDPWGVGVNPNTNRVYVANSAAGYTGNVSVIDGETHSVSTVYLGPGSHHPTGVGVNPNTNRIYVYDVHDVRVIDGETNTLATSIAVPGAVWSGGEVGVNPNTNLIYVSNEADTVSVIDGETNSVVGTVSVGDSPRGVAVNPVTNRIYVANNGVLDHTVSVIDGETNGVVTVSVGHRPWGVAVNPNTNRVYVANCSGDHTVSVIDGETNSVIATTRAWSACRGVAVNPNTNNMYVSGSERVYVIDGETNRAVVTVAVGGEAPYGLGVNPNTNRIYAANYGPDNVSVIGYSASPVGGIAELPTASDSKPLNYIPLATLTAAALLTLTAGALYARRRRAR